MENTIRLAINFNSIAKVVANAKVKTNESHTFRIDGTLNGEKLILNPNLVEATVLYLITTNTETIYLKDRAEIVNNQIIIKPSKEVNANPCDVLFEIILKTFSGETIRSPFINYNIIESLDYRKEQ